MKTFALSWISFFDNELHMEEFLTTSIENALKEAYRRLTGTEFDSLINDDIMYAAFNCDGMIGALEITYGT